MKSRKDGDPYLVLEFGDRSGRLSGNVWDDAKTLYHDLKVGGVVRLRGMITTFRDEPQVSVERVRSATDKDVYDVKDLLPALDDDVGELLGQLQDVVKTVSNPPLQKLLDLFFSNQDFLDKFKTAPGGKLWHHACLGGLLKHTLSVLRICEAAAREYPLVDRDLLVTGALLHDVGKIYEFEYRTFIDYSDQGRLHGHIVIGERMVADKIGQINDFPDELRDRLLHLMLSHQGRQEYGSPVVPKMLEAIILYFADDMDAKADGFSRIIKQQRESGKRWSDWVHLLDRFIFLGEEGEKT